MYVSSEVKIIEQTITANSIIISDAVIKSFVDFLDVAPLTVKTYKAGISRFVYYLQCKGIKQPERKHITNFKASLSNCGCKPATIAAYLSALRRFFDWTQTEGLYPNITLGIKAPKIDKGHKRDFLSASQLQNMITAAHGDTLEDMRNEAVLALMTVGGLRTVEIVRANVEDVSTQGGQNVLFVQGKGRNDKKEYIKLTKPVLDAIRSYLSARGQVKGHEPLFASCSRRNKGGRLTTRTISGIAKTAMRKTGYDSPRLTAHSLRHSAVTLALMNGAGLAEAQVFARHSNIATTLIYAHNIDRLHSTCEGRITRAVFGYSGLIGGETSDRLPLPYTPLREQYTNIKPQDYTEIYQHTNGCTYGKY